MKLFWPAIGKDFSGVVLGYDAPSKNHTVRWDNAPGGSSGVTEVCIDEGVVTWLAPPEGSLAAGGGSSKGGSSSKQQKTPEKKKDKDGGAPKEAKPPKEVSKETLEEVQARIGSGTIKGICFRVLKNAGAHGMLLSEIVETTQKLGLKDWTSVRQPSNTVSVLQRRPAFVKVAPGRVGLACLGAAESPDLASAGGARTRREGAVLRGVPRRSVQHQGDAHAHLAVVRVRAWERQGARGAGAPRGDGQGGRRDR